MQIILKAISYENDHFLKDIFYDAIFIPPSEKPLPRSIIYHPDLTKYYMNWGKKGDYGIIAEYENQWIGAVWCRLFAKNNKGYGYIDQNTPELSIAIKQPFRNQGIGTQLMLSFLQNIKNHGYSTGSLSVDKRNKAVEWYKRLGFEMVVDNKNDYVMKKKL